VTSEFSGFGEAGDRFLRSQAAGATDAVLSKIDKLSCSPLLQSPSMMSSNWQGTATTSSPQLKLGQSVARPKSGGTVRRTPHFDVPSPQVLRRNSVNTSPSPDCVGANTKPLANSATSAFPPPLLTSVESGSKVDVLLCSPIARPKTQARLHVPKLPQTLPAREDVPIFVTSLSARASPDILAAASQPPMLHPIKAVVAGVSSPIRKSALSSSIRKRSDERTQNSSCLPEMTVSPARTSTLHKGNGKVAKGSPTKHAHSSNGGSSSSHDLAVGTPTITSPVHRPVSRAQSSSRLLRSGPLKH
jgi:hypothetical protein